MGGDPNDTLAQAENLWKQGDHDGAWLALEELEPHVRGTGAAGENFWLCWSGRCGKNDSPQGLETQVNLDDRVDPLEELGEIALSSPGIWIDRCRGRLGL